MDLITTNSVQNQLRHNLYKQIDFSRLFMTQERNYIILDMNQDVFWE